MSELVVYGFETSNNFKVRVALGYKGIPYTFHSIDPADRSEVLRLSGQPLTPTIVHDGKVVFDSAAILRYLDANFLDTPRLFPADREAIHEIESWESFARRELHAPVMVAVRQRREGRRDEAEIARGQQALVDVTARLEERLADREWLVGEELTAADVSAAPVVFRSLDMDFYAAPDERPRTLEWMDRVMAFDQPPD